MADIINFHDYYEADEFDYTIPKNSARLRCGGGKSFKPERQGSLDSLCGVYCIVNAVSYVAELSNKQRISLFKQLVKSLNKTSSVSQCLRNGTSKKQLCFMLKIAQSYLSQMYNIRVTITQPLKNTDLTKQDYMSAVDGLLKDRKHVLIIDMRGVHHHWTCITSTTSKKLKLLDSDGISHLKKESCLITKKHNKKHHCLHPSGTWVVSLKN